MKARRVLLAAAIGFGAVTVLLVWPRGDKPGASARRRTVAQNSTAGIPIAPAPLLKAPRVNLPQPERTNVHPRSVPENGTAAPPRQAGRQPASQTKPALKDPLAREVLAFVGTDEAADEYWAAAINDPALPAEERQDLIEDLNEDGLSDPKHPVLEDLPLILNRLQLIEAMAPDAIDGVNADAFTEAYRDLVNLAAVVLGGGEPVK